MSFYSQAVYIKLQLFCFCVLYFCHGLLGDLARFRQEFRDTRERMHHFLSRNMFFSRALIDMGWWSSVSQNQTLTQLFNGAWTFEERLAPLLMIRGGPE